MHMYPTDYFCAFNYKNKRQLKTKNTYAIHQFEGSWVQIGKRSIWWLIRKKMKANFRKMIGETVYWGIKDFFTHNKKY